LEDLVEHETMRERTGVHRRGTHRGHFDGTDHGRGAARRPDLDPVCDRASRGDSDCGVHDAHLAVADYLVADIEDADRDAAGDLVVVGRSTTVTESSAMGPGSIHVEERPGREGRRKVR